MYRHTQTGHVILAALVLSGAVPLVVLFALPPVPGAGGTRAVLAVVLLVLLLCGAVFHRLTVTVEGGRLAWCFGFGLLRKSVPVSEIAEVEPTRTSALAGWGIRWTPRGWLYNVSGLDAVRIRLHGGRSFLLGTDQPAELAAAIERERARLPG